jgi:hypothetical protein
MKAPLYDTDGRYLGTVNTLRGAKLYARKYSERRNVELLCLNGDYIGQRRFTGWCYRVY